MVLPPRPEPVPARAIAGQAVPPAREPSGPGFLSARSSTSERCAASFQKVAWPGRTEVANYTVVVLVTVVLLTLFVFFLDYAFAKGVIYLFRK